MMSSSRASRRRCGCGQRRRAVSSHAACTSHATRRASSTRGSRRCVRRQGLAGLPRAVERIADAVVRGERIGVFGDYDVDGVTTAALLTSFLRAAGADGRGRGRAARRGLWLHLRGRGRLRRARLPARSITGDCGTSDLEAIATASALGVEVIVVDHHTVPRRTASIRRCRWSIRSAPTPRSRSAAWPRSGSGSMSRPRCAPSCAIAGISVERSRPEPDVRDLLDLVALGTIADLVPLTAENRILTALGLRRLQSRARPGVAALLAAAGVEAEREVDAPHRRVEARSADQRAGPARRGGAIARTAARRRPRPRPSARRPSRPRTPSAARSRTASSPRRSSASGRATRGPRSWCPARAGPRAWSASSRPSSSTATSALRS